MTPTVRLALKYADLLLGERMLIVGAPTLLDVTALDEATAGRAHFFFVDHSVFRPARERLGERASAGAWLAPTVPYDRALLFLPKGKSRRDMFLSMLARCLGDDAQLLLVGQNDEGIKTARPALERHFRLLLDERHGYHARLLQATEPGPRDDGALEPWLTDFAVERPDGALHLVALPGVFSEGRLDVGTAFLLQHWRIPPGAALLDVGCGAGVLGLLAAREARAASVCMVDTDYLAVEAARRSAAAAGQANVRVLASDVYSDVSGQFDVVVSNPPFHRGVRTDYDAVERIIAGAPSVLRPHGALWLVANAFLPYLERIRASFGNGEVVAKNSQFAVYHARRRG